MSPWIIAAIVAGAAAALAAIGMLLYYVALPKLVLHKMTASPNPDGEMTYPDHFEEMQARTAVVRDLLYPSAYPANLYNLYLPAEASAAAPAPLIVWIHGGGFIGGTKDGGDNVMTALCAAGYAVASIDYAVAPAYRYPTAVRQAAEFAAHLPDLLAQNPSVDGDRLILGGDSAGAQIALQYLATQIDPAYAEEMGIAQTITSRLKAAVLVCGPFDFLAIRAYAQKTNPMFRRLVDIWGRIYFGKLRWYKNAVARQSAAVGRINANCPPVFLTDGNHGSFEAQNRKLAARLRSVGVPAEELYFDPAEGEVPHEYLFHLDRPESLRAMSAITDFLDRYTK